MRAAAILAMALVASACAPRRVRVRYYEPAPQPYVTNVAPSYYAPVPGYSPVYAPGTIYYAGGFYGGVYYRPGYYPTSAPFVSVQAPPAQYVSPAVVAPPPPYAQPVGPAYATPVTPYAGTAQPVYVRPAQSTTYVAPARPAPGRAVLVAPPPPAAATATPVAPR